MGICGVRGRSLSGLATILSNCRKFEALALTFVSFTSDGVESLIRGINTSTNLKVVFLASCEMPTGGLNRVMQALANSNTVKQLTLELAPSDELPAMRQLTNLSYLSIETDDKNRLLQYDSACYVLDLLETSEHLKELQVNGLELPPARLADILKRNSTLDSLKLVNCSKINKMGRAVHKALRASNGTLTTVEVTGEKGRLPSPTLKQQLTYYTELNKVGRAQVMHEHTASMSDLVRILGEWHRPTQIFLRQKVFRIVFELHAKKFHVPFVMVFYVKCHHCGPDITWKTRKLPW